MKTKTIVLLIEFPTEFNNSQFRECGKTLKAGADLLGLASVYLIEEGPEDITVKNFIENACNPLEL